LKTPPTRKGEFMPKTLHTLEFQTTLQRLKNML
jgi:hypothetical protein